MRVWIEK